MEKVDNKHAMNEDVKECEVVKGVDVVNKDNEKVNRVEEYEFISEAAKVDSKAEDDLDQMIAFMLDSDDKVNKDWDNTLNTSGYG